MQKCKSSILHESTQWEKRWDSHVGTQLGIISGGSVMGQCRWAHTVTDTGGKNDCGRSRGKELRTAEAERITQFTSLPLGLKYLPPGTCSPSAWGIRTVSPQRGLGACCNQATAFLASSSIKVRRGLSLGSFLFQTFPEEA